MQIHYIQEQELLDAVCQQFASMPVLAIDTEFVRTRTLFPKLGLLQVCDGNQIVLIDPIAIPDLSAFWALLTNEKITKVLHACSEDLEVFLTAGNCKPVNLIDTQILMSFLGHGLSMGYAAMVKHFLDIELDKSESRTDWTKRPLTERQLTYAQADVDYLFKIYPSVIQAVEEAGWLTASRQETQLLIDKKFTPNNADELYKGVKLAWRLNPAQLNRLQHLSRWRYEQAVSRDLPISFVVKDHTLLGVAQYNPSNTGAMAKIEGVDAQDIRYKGKAMLAVLKKANAVDELQYPTKITRLDEYPGYKQIFKKVKNFVSQIAQQSGLTVEHIASKKQINQFLTYHFDINDLGDKPEKVDILQDWRLQLFGEKLKDFANNEFK